MASPFVSNVSMTGQPTDYAMEARDIDRRRKYAEMLQQQAMTVDPQQVAGGYVVPVSWTQGLAKALQAGVGAYQSRQADEREKALMARQQAAQTADSQAMAGYLRGTPGTPEAMDENMVTTPGRAAVAPMSGEMPAMQTPEYRQMLMQMLMKKAEKDAESPWAKFDPSKFTAESVAKYGMTKNPADLVAARKLDQVTAAGPTGAPETRFVDAYTPQAPIAQPVQNEMVNQGDQVTPVNRFTQNTPLPMSMTPGQTATTTLAAANSPFLPNGQPNPEYQAYQTSRARAGAPQISVSTERGYGQQFAGKVADADVGMRDAAIKAPDLADRANRIKELVSTGKVITGTGADYRLALGKALNLVGANDGETASNTEALVTSMAENTLDAIKASGLGAGNGFSNADRDFLEKAKGGKITLQAETINRLADLAHRSAEKTAERWSTRVQEIPESALAGTGIKRDRVSVSPLYESSPAGAGLPPASAIEAEIARRTRSRQGTQ